MKLKLTIEIRNDGEKNLFDTISAIRLAEIPLDNA